ncbi:hypothetical protein [Microbacterium aurugineum]|uniref:Uncharacterized protein n=1 Tax=Microbacterium aurugineum TaxID=2851642 RepID=A0ABY4J0U1_9MICO|nr:hypothetical protein [Microbacterium aurugineum]UPL17333.1 hypothetical protein KV397_05980 [Microbacterium aurugineum]
MTEHPATPQLNGLDVYIITYDEEGNEERLLPSELTGDVTDRSPHLGINKGTWTIDRIKHGPFIASEPQLRLVNVGSLGRALAVNGHGTTLIVDRSAPPLDEDIADVDQRYDVDMMGEAVVASITKRYPTQPPETNAEIASRLERVAAAYDCRIIDVSFTLAGGGTPEEMLSDWPEGDELLEPFRAQTIDTLTTMAHDVTVSIATDEGKTMAALLDGAAAMADYLSATQTGPLDASAVLNLLRGGHFNLLIGESESDYLEVKTQMHAISAPGDTGKRAKVELAQDVARFANGSVDAVLVIGYREQTGGGNQIGSLTPVADAILNIPQIQELLDARIVPPLDGLVIEKFPTSHVESVLAIYVPTQPSEMQPYLVHGAIVGGKVEGAFFSIVRRRGEGSITTSAQQIHAYIVAGRRYLREPATSGGPANQGGAPVSS